MSDSLEHLFENNRRWADEVQRQRPGFFTSLLAQQAPQYMWIGCSDSRVPANQIAGLDPGEVFVHRNVANVVAPSDLNLLSTLQYAVDLLHIRHLMVVGHYGCGGVRAALYDQRVGLADNWLRHIKDVRDRYAADLQAIDEPQRLDALCELHTLEQVLNVAKTTVVQDAWSRNQALALHAWVYGLHDGLAKDLHFTVSKASDVPALFAQALGLWRQRYGLT